MYFEWDEEKNKTNIRKHGISFDTAKLIFDDPYILNSLDNRFIYKEERWVSIGLVINVLIFLVHTIGVDNHGEEIIRFISARKAVKSERQRYLQNHPKNEKRVATISCIIRG